MNKLKLISFDLKSDFGFFKKPDINEINLTYNMIPKPVFLGILGAVIGLKGYEECGKEPEFYSKLKHLKIGICPLGSSEGNFEKTMIKYNNAVGYANEDAGILNITEQTLIDPGYKCYIMLDIDNDIENILYENLKASKAEYIPYLGKNEYQAVWDNFTEYPEYEKFDFEHNFKIDTLFSKTDAISEYIIDSNVSVLNMSKAENTWLYFERLPVGFDTNRMQYVYDDFVFSNAEFKPDIKNRLEGDFYKISSDNKIIQLF